jgi:hypothetical protein
MAEVAQVLFDYDEVVEALIKKQGIHEGIWQLSIEFGIAAANLEGIKTSEDPEAPINQITPSAIIPIRKIGIIRTHQLSNIAVDAAKVNPKQKVGSQKGKAEIKES